MRILPYSDASLAEAISLLRTGAVIAHATETCYGLACDLTNCDAVARLFAIKDRPVTQPISALFASIEDAKRYVEWNTRAEELAKKYLPGPLTLILPLRSDAPHRLFPNPNPNPTLGIRISSHPHARSLVAAFGSPLSTTSANLHGQPNPYSAEEIVQQFAEREYVPVLILDSGGLPRNPPSTVIDLSKEGKILRRGSFFPLPMGEACLPVGRVKERGNFF